MCAAAEAADDPAAALHEQEKVVSREVDAARKRRVQPAAAPADDVAAARLDQNKVARREADAARRRRSRAADAHCHTLKCVWSGLCVPLPSLQTTRRPHFASRRGRRVARLMLRAGVGRVQLMPLPRSDVCVVVYVRHDV